MAQTIQIRRGTGSAVPSSLAAGELAINTDTGKFYYGNGSAVSSNFRVNSITAENYIVCSSVSNITTQTLSGSTQFGDSADDTHQFTGAITASGNISASGIITAEQLTTSDDLTVGDDINLSTGGKIYFDGAGGSVYADSNGNDLDLTANNNIDLNASQYVQIVAGNNPTLRMYTNDASVNTNNTIGLIEWQTADATDVRSAMIQVRATENHDDGNNAGGKLQFYTANADTENLVLTLDENKAATFTSHITASGDIKATGTNATLRGERIIIDPHNSVNQYSRIAAYTSGSEDSINVALQLGVDASSSAGNFRGDIANGYGVALSFTSQRDDSSLSTTYETGRISSYLKAGAQGSSDQHGMKFRIRNDDTNIDALTIMPGSPDSDAKIGIMDTTPSYTLDVNGDIRCTDDLFVNDDATVTGKLQVNESAIVDGYISSSGIVYIDDDIRFSSNHAAIFFDDPGNEYTFGLGQGGLIINAGITNPASISHFIVSSSGVTSLNASARVAIGGIPDTTNMLTVYGNISASGAIIAASANITDYGDINADTIRLTSTTDASATSTGHAFQAGATNSTNVIIDNNEIMARNNGVISALHLNPDGGNVSFNASTDDNVRIGSGHITASGDISASGKIYSGEFYGEGDPSAIGSRVIEATTTEHNFGSAARITKMLGTAITLDAPVTASGAISASGDIMTSGTIQAGWHGSTTRIKILVSDFIPDDIGRPAMIDDTGSDRWLESHGTGKLFASIPIPTGFTATHVHIYGSATSAVTVYEADINSKTVTSKGTGNIGTEIDITDVASDTTNYLFLELAQASGEEVYGGYVTITPS